MASKTLRRSMDQDAHIPINPLDPVLTSLSTDKQLRPSMCPFTALGSNSDGDSNSSDNSSSAGPSAVGKCPVDHMNIDDASQTINDASKGDSSSPPPPSSSLPPLPSTSSTIDYLQLADEVDKWLESQLE